VQLYPTLEKQITEKDFQISQLHKQIKQLHILLQQASQKQITHEPEQTIGVFSRVLVKFGL